MPIEPFQIWHIHDCLTEFGDLEFQQKYWVEGREPERICANPIETYAVLFDDMLFDEVLDESEVVERLLPEELADLKAFVKALDSFYDIVLERDSDGRRGIDPEAMIRHPDWTEITKMAQRAASHVERRWPEQVAKDPYKK